MQLNRSDAKGHGRRRLLVAKAFQVRLCLQWALPGIFGAGRRPRPPLARWGYRYAGFAVALPSLSGRKLLLDGNLLMYRLAMAAPSLLSAALFLLIKTQTDADRRRQTKTKTKMHTVQWQRSLPSPRCTLAIPIVPRRRPGRRAWGRSSDLSAERAVPATFILFAEDLATANRRRFAAFSSTCPLRI